MKRKIIDRVLSKLLWFLDVRDSEVKLSPYVISLQREGGGIGQRNKM